jgi:hypothetical protein
MDGTTVFRLQLSCLKTSSAGVHSRRILSTMTAAHLFETALHSRAMFRLVSDYLSHLDDPTDEFSESDFSETESEYSENGNLHSPSYVEYPLSENV